MDRREFLALLAAAAAAPHGAWAQAPAPSTNFKRHALLVGCTEYEHLIRKLWLDGPSNDVGLMKKLLTERFSFDPAEIVTLVQENPTEKQPRHDNIVREIEALRDRVAENDEVFILFAGHGSQQPDVPEEDAALGLGADDDAAQDGLDEVFLPCDVTNWEAKQKVVRGITDDQIHKWLTEIRSKGAFVFFVADTCHSGTMSRGPESDSDEKVKTRHVSPDMLTPQPVLDAIKKRADERAEAEAKAADEARAKAKAEGKPEAQPAAPAAPAKPEGPKVGGLVTFAAVPSHCLEQEQKVPPKENFADPTFGRLTYAMNAVLTKAQKPLTYRELAQNVGVFYQEQGWFPLGLIEATSDGVDREVLGKQEWRDRSSLVVSPGGEGGLELSKGLANGLTNNSILRVFPPAGSADSAKALGYVMITDAGVVTSVVEPVSYGETPAVPVEAVPPRARCEVEVVDYGQLQVAVNVRAISEQERAEFAAAGTTVSAPDDATLSTVRQGVDVLMRQPESLIRPAPRDSTADVYLLVAQEAVYLRRRGQPVTQVAAQDDAAKAARTIPPQVYGPYPINPTLTSRLSRDLAMVARGLNLHKLAQMDPGADMGRRGPTPAVSILMAFSRGSNREGPFTDVADLTQVTFTEGDWLCVDLVNVGANAADVTLLYLDAAFKIQSHFPSRKQALTAFANTIDPEQSRQVFIRINDSTVGLEDMLMLAVMHPPGEPPVNFAFLEQPGLTPAGFGKSRGTGKESPLDKLLKASLGGTRGAAVATEIGTYSVQRRSLAVVKRSSTP